MIEERKCTIKCVRKEKVKNGLIVGESKSINVKIVDVAIRAEEMVIPKI